MALLLKKFGGSSLATVERIQKIAGHIVDERKAGHDVVVVVSAMGGETERLIDLSKAICDTPDLREYDALLATGECASIALMSMALIQMDCPAVSLNARQLRILTDNQHKFAHIHTVEIAQLKRHLQAGKVPVIAGFQGVNEFNELTTLDRGGSDATAVALAYALKADECQIYTDVSGVYSADPHLLEVAQRIPALSYDEMLQMADAGAKVMQKYSVELAAQHQVPLRVKSSFEEGEGTLLVNEEHCQFKSQSVQAVTSHDGLALLRFQASSPAHELQQVIALFLNKNIKIHHISQQYYSYGLSLNIVISESDFASAKLFLDKKLHIWPHMQFSYELARAEVAVVGHALDNHVYLEIQNILQQQGIVADLVFSSPLKISLIFSQKSLKLLVSMLHQRLAIENN